MNVEIAQRLAELRRERGFSQEGLAAELGLSRQAVSKWERAESAPDMGNLMALADLYGVTIDELLRVDADIADDVRFECQDRRESAEAEAAQAAEAAQDAALRAESAASVAQEAASSAAATTVGIAAASAEDAPAAGEPAAPSAAVPPATIADAPDPASSAQPDPAPGPAQPAGAPGPASTAQPADAPDFASTAQAPAGATPPPPPPYGFAGYQAPPAPAAPPVAPSLEPLLPKSALRSFPYPLLCVVLFFLGGFTVGFGLSWAVYLTIPFWYWIVNVIEADPLYHARRVERYRAAQEAAAQQSMPSAGAVPPQGR